MKSTRLTLRLVAAALLATTAVPAHAVLLDHGPADPLLVFPIWYRDLNGLAMKECLSTVASPNPGSLGKPMCFPLNPDPAGFAGNVGPEVFYNGLNMAVSGPAFSLKYVAAVEASYIPAGLPVHGTEAVFSRLRFTGNVSVAGTYKITHPFGVEVINVKPADLGARAIFTTIDVPFASPGNFDGVLAGNMGPWLQWDFVDVGFTLTNSAGEQFVSDPNFFHTFTGSPFLTNFLRVDGPVGSNLDGVGNDFIQTPLGNLVGQIYTAAIPTPLTIKRATYDRDPVKGKVGIDVWATSAPGATMILTGAGMPSVKMLGDALGNYFSHIETPIAVLPPTTIQVTNTTSVPVNSATAQLVDLVTINTATFDSLTRSLSLTAGSSDLVAPGPALDMVGPLGGRLTAGAYSTVLAAGVLPPTTVSVISGAGGKDTQSVAVLPNNAAFTVSPVAVADVVTTNENTALAINVTANDAVITPASVIVINPPASGTAVPVAATPGVVTYTPNNGFFGVDTFQYVEIDAAGNVSNLATVTVNVVFVAVGPTANADDFAMIQNRTTPLVGRTINVLANDTAAAGTAINPASVKISSAPLHGTAVVNADGSITYTPVLNYTGADSYQYTVANTAGAVSTPATVSIVVEGGAEVLSISKATFRVSTSKWTIVGSTNWFGATLLHTTATCWVGKGVAAGPLIGTAAIDTTGKFQLVPPTLTDPPPDATNIFTCQTSNGAVVSAVVVRN
ncbi:MAG TPA: Ig-like domain-containing protein [Anaeromyxobacteraceae bacterium]|nr:Ig-like domain-containing protein [Anaeromyxobacteraceae bacterium]